jgi:hypothetical protein
MLPFKPRNKQLDLIILSLTVEKLWELEQLMMVRCVPVDDWAVPFDPSARFLTVDNMRSA